jgi:hypothetical protein
LSIPDCGKFDLEADPTLRFRFVAGSLCREHAVNERGDHDAALVAQRPSDEANTALQRASPTASISLDTPLRLETAAELAFPDGTMTASGLRREQAKGNLVIERIANKDYTTLRNIEEMRKKCRVQAKGQDFGSNRRSMTKPANSSVAQHGSLETERVKNARAALEETAQGLSKRSPPTLPASTKSRASTAVILLKSPSSTS